MSSFTVPIEPPPRPSVVQYGPSGEVFSDGTERALADRHVAVLSKLPTAAFLADIAASGQNDDGEDPAGQEPPRKRAAVGDDTASSISESVVPPPAAANMPALLGHLRAAISEADQLSRMLGLVRGGRQLQHEPRPLLPSTPFPPPMPEPLVAFQMSERIDAAAGALRLGAASLREVSARAVRAVAEARALRAHWRLTALDADVSAAVGDSGGHTLRLHLAGRTDADVDDTEGVVELLSDATGSLVLPKSERARHVAVVTLSDGSDAVSRPRGIGATLPFLEHAHGAGAPRTSASHAPESSLAVEDGDAMSVAAAVARTHRALLAKQFDLDSRAVFAKAAAEAQQPKYSGAVLQAQTHSIVFDSPNASGVCVKLALSGEQAEEPHGDVQGLEGGKGGESDTVPSSPPPPPPHLGPIEVGMFGCSRSQGVGVLDYALEAATLHAQQRSLRRSLDALAASSHEPTLRTHWNYAPAGCGGTARRLAVSVEVHILSGAAGAMRRPSVTSAISVLVSEGRVHAQHVAGVASSAEGVTTFPLEALRAVGQAADGVRALTAVVRAALGRTLLLRLRETAERHGFHVEPTGVGGDCSMRVHRSAPLAHPDPAPWVEVALAGAPSPSLVDVTTRSSEKEAPQRIDVGCLAFAGAQGMHGPAGKIEALFNKVLAAATN